MEQRTSKGEIAWINTAKTICIILVYFFHTEVYLKFDASAFHNIYVPFYTNGFFFISGYLLFRKQLEEPVKSAMKREWMLNWGGQMLNNTTFKIAVPTILFSSVIFFPKTIIRGQGIELYSFLHDTIYGGSIWFTCALTVAELIIFLYLLTRKVNIWLYTFMSAILTVIAIGLAKANVGIAGDTDIPWFYKGGMIASLFICFGGIFYKYEDKIRGLNKRIWYVIPVIYLIFSALYIQAGDVSINVASLSFCGFISVLLGITTLVALCSWMQASKICNYIGRNTLGLYFLSGAIPNVIAILVSRLNIQAGWMLYVVLSIISFSIALPVVYMLNKYLPFVFDLRKLKKY